MTTVYRLAEKHYSRKRDRQLLVLSRTILLGCVLAVVVAAEAPPQGMSIAASSDRFDVLIRGGRLLDGSGNPWFYADVGVRQGVIAALGRLDGARAIHEIDARGKFVTPGFIDLHSHADDNDFYSAAGVPAERHDRGVAGTLRDPDPRRRAASNLVTQGVTLVVVNQDGSSPWPIRDQRATLEKLGVGVNVALLVGHNTVRQRVLGDDFRRAATADEIRRMQAMVRQGMEEGAFGFSAALEYIPALWSTTDEMVALVSQIVPFGGVYIQHERSSGAAPMWWNPSQDAPGPPTVLDAVNEAVEIGERTGARVDATHLKVRGVTYWGTSQAIIKIIERARARGVEIWGDQYPYVTTGTDGDIVLLPGWALGFDQWGTLPETKRTLARDFRTALRHTLDNPATAALVRRDVAYQLTFRGGADNIVVFEHPENALVGKSVAELAAARHIPAVDMVINLQLEGFPDRPGGGRLRGFSLSEDDVDAFAVQPWVATASDGGLALPQDGPNVHPRYYGTFPRKIRRYALDKKMISIEQAIRSCTSLPAQILGLYDRGLIRKGFPADLVVLDLARLRDRATFDQPHQYSEGIEYVLVNGEIVVEHETPTWALPGEVLKPSAISSPDAAR